MTPQPAAATVWSAVSGLREQVLQFLCDLISLPSISGQEDAVAKLVAKRFSELANVEEVALSNSLRTDVDFSDPIPGLDYERRANVRLSVPGTKAARSLLFNTHLDVVPPSEGQERPFEPFTKDGIVHGRGACDAKGQVAVLFATLLALKYLRLAPLGHLIAHLVVEEENGGNGSLAMIRRGEQADACIVLEPTDLSIITSVRGAVWFRVTCHGRAGHSGQPGSSISALKMAVEVLNILERYHDRLLETSRGVALFDRFSDPMPINFGRIVAGDWPATAPARAVVEGVLGLLPNRTRYQVMAEMDQAIREEANEWLRDHFSLEFTYRHDAHVLDPGHPLVTELQTSCRETGVTGDISALTASGDSWLYNNQLGIPTVMFGPGSLRFAHSSDEQVDLKDIETAAVVLTQFIGRWCGLEEVTEV